MNDICCKFPVSDPTDTYPDPLPDASLLMDDCALWVSGDDPITVVDKLNSRLRHIYDWSVFNAMVFDFQKFNILSIGHNPIPHDIRNTVCFGPGSPPWVKSARFIGAQLDPLLSFKKQIRIITRKVKSGIHYISPFSHFARGSHPHILETNFRIYVWPRFIFTEPLWIFRIKTPFHYSADFNYGYKTIFGSLES